MSTPTFLQVSDVARRIGRSPARAKQIIDAGLIRAVRTPSGQRLVEESELERYLRERAAADSARVAS